MKFPHADDLTTEEINYELLLRNRPEEREKDVQTKLRLLRRLFQEDKKEGREYRPPYKFEQEVDLITNRVQQIQQAIEKENNPKLVSRLRHYYLRVKRAEVVDVGMEPTRILLLSAIKETLRTHTSNTAEEEVEEENEGNTANKDKEEAKNLGAIPKNPATQQKENSPKSDSQKVVKQRTPYENFVGKLEATLQQLKMQGSHIQQKEPEVHNRAEQVKGKMRIPPRDVTEDDSSESEEGERRSKRSSTRMSKWNNTRKAMNSRSKRDQEDMTDEFYSEYEEPRRYDRWTEGNDQRRHDRPQRYNNQRNRHQREDEQRGRGHRSPSGDRYSTRSSYGSDAYRRRNVRQARRIEHWKLSFSGDIKATSVENFLYKLKKIADREGVSQWSLLRDIHLILEGQASDWFFTYVDEFEDWDDFEEKIRFRFGNPNQDQGIRQRIHERRQHRGETFSAFVSEIERLNKMLSRPLSKRRKFEVVWDNMRPHYRSKTSIIQIRDLDHLIKINHRIDAADTNFQPHTETRNAETRNQRNVHQVECASSSDGSEEPEDVDVVEARPDARGQRTSHRNQPTRMRTTTATTDGQSSQSQGNLCWNCRKPGHNWRDCRESRAIFCYGCGELGRTIRSCPKCIESNRGRGRQNQGNN